MPRGGARPGAGRKPDKFRELRARLQAEKVEDAERAFDFHVQVMESNKEPTALRLAAATWVYETICGKPKEHREHSGKLELEYINDWRKNPTADTA